MKTKAVKIVFTLDVDEDGFPPIASEALNARIQGDGFVLENTPFFVTGVGLGDLVQAHPIPNQPEKFQFANVLRSSTSKSISIIFLEDDVAEDVFQSLNAHGCICEYGEFGANEPLRMLAVSVPPSCDYPAIAEYLAGLEERELLSYSELAI